MRCLGIVGREKATHSHWNLEHGWVKTIVGMFTRLNVNDPFASVSHFTISPNHMHPHFLHQGYVGQPLVTTQVDGASVHWWAFSPQKPICRQVWLHSLGACEHCLQITMPKTHHHFSSRQRENMFIEMRKNKQQAPQMTGSKQCPNQTWSIALPPPSLGARISAELVRDHRARLWVQGDPYLFEPAEKGKIWDADRSLPVCRTVYIIKRETHTLHTQIYIYINIYI